MCILNVPVYCILQVVSRRDSGRGDTVVVNGVRHSLDLVALIAYFKLKKKCQGLYTLTALIYTVDDISVYKHDSSTL